MPGFEFIDPQAVTDVTEPDGFSRVDPAGVTLLGTGVNPIGTSQILTATSPNTVDPTGVTDVDNQFVAVDVSRPSDRSAYNIEPQAVKLVSRA